MFYVQTKFFYFIFQIFQFERLILEIMRWIDVIKFTKIREIKTFYDVNKFF